jgi:hypothetical protein
MGKKEGYENGLKKGEERGSIAQREGLNMKNDQGSCVVLQIGLQEVPQTAGDHNPTCQL